MKPLTELEKRRTRMLLNGFKLRGIAKEESASISAVKQTLHKVYCKVGVSNRIDLAIKLCNEGTMKKIFASVILVLAVIGAHAQGGQLPTATTASTTLTITYPVACTAANPCNAQVLRCTGNQTVCTATSSNWTPLFDVLNNGASYIDSTGVAGTTYTYEVTVEQGSPIGSGLVAGPSNFYTGTPTAPLAPATISGATS